MLRAVLARAPWVRSAPRAHGSRAGTPAGRRDRDPHRPHPPRRKAPQPAGSARAPLSGSWTGPACPRPTPASPSSPPVALLVSTSAFGGLTHFCRHLPRDSGCTLFSVLRKNFSV